MESVWDYPRPPALDPTDRLVTVEFAGVTVAETRRAIRILETSQAPVFAIPSEDVATEHLEPSRSRTFCEWKGQAEYFDLVVGDRRSHDAAWRYADPVPRYADIAGYLSFYPQRVDACRVDGELARPMDGCFYGGWITSEISGPIKGGPGTALW